ncbi:MAG TPA: hypothetical protein VEF90_16500 [Xanthobacteraceae bacterium]|nr:hypothetical protein [Xanthobacteraceae bacterium]
MPIAQVGQVNVSALNVPQILVQIVPPQFLFNGVATNVCGIVGTASWGPVNLAQPFGNYAQYVSIFGPTINRLYDMGGHVLLAAAQGAGYFAGVRITDGTDTAAGAVVPATGAAAATGSLTFSANPSAAATITLNGTVWTFVSAITGSNQLLIGTALAATLTAAAAVLNASADANTAKMTYVATATAINIAAVALGTGGNALTLAASAATASGAVLSGGTAGTTGVTWTAKYTGSLGNSVAVLLTKGTAANSYKIVVSCPGLATEIYDNVGANLSGLALWTALAAAINNGSSTIRPPSNIIIATAGTATAAPILASTPLSGGTDGVTSITTATFLGVDAPPRSGMYCLRHMGVAQFDLCDCSDLTSLSTQIAFGVSIGAYCIFATQPSDTISNAAAELSQYGIDSFVAKVLFGDWIIWNDSVTATPQRMTSPQAVSLGFFGNASPQRNSLNKPIQGIVGTQSTVLGKTYGYSDFQNLAAARMDVITLDRTITNNFVHRLGINTSSNPVIMGDEYTRVIFFLAKSIQVVGAQYIGANMTPTEMLQAKVALQQFLALAQTNGIIYTFDGSQAYQVVLDTSNNTQATAALGYQYAYVKAIIGPIVRYFIINLEGGSSVTISNTPPGQ